MVLMDMDVLVFHCRYACELLWYTCMGPDRGIFAGLYACKCLIHVS